MWPSKIICYMQRRALNIKSISSVTQRWDEIMHNLVVEQNHETISRMSPENKIRQRTYWRRRGQGHESISRITLRDKKRQHTSWRVKQAHESVI